MPTKTNSKLESLQPNSHGSQPVSEMLTPAELASLRRTTKEQLDYGLRAFAHLRPLKDKPKS